MFSGLVTVVEIGLSYLGRTRRNYGKKLFPAPAIFI